MKPVEMSHPTIPWTVMVMPQYMRHYMDDGWTITAKRLTMWQCECGWSNTGFDMICQRCALDRP